ncbi:MAG: hypothetical protein QXQ81_00365 [Candidatus Thorarchaeota archaeon]
MESVEQEMSMLGELRSKFEHPAQHIERTRATNEMILQRDVRQHAESLRTAFPSASDEDYLLIAASFRYLNVNGLLPEDYVFDDYISDVRLVTTQTSTTSAESLIQKLELVVRVLVEAIAASFEVLVTTIDEKSSKTPDRVVQSVIMYRHYVTSAERIAQMIYSDVESADVRLVGAVLLHGLMMMYRIKRRQVPIWSLSKLYSEVVEKYPLSKGSDLYWDLIRVVILAPNYEKIVELGRKTIDARLEVLEREKKAGRVATFRVVRPSADEQDISMAGESILYEVLRRSGDLSEDKLTRIERMFDVSLRQTLNRKYGRQDLAESELIVDAAADMFSRLIHQFELLAFSVIPPNRFSEFLQDPRKFVNDNQNEIPLLTKKKIQTIAGGAATTRTVASALVRLVQTAATTGRSQLSRR